MTVNQSASPRELTLGHLEAELGADRRTIRKALREAGIGSTGSINGHPTWTVRAALDALAQRAERVRDQRLERFRRPKPEAPFWLQAIDDHARTPLERGFCVGVMRALYELPRVIVAVGVQGDARLSMSQAFAVAGEATIGLMNVTFENGREMGLPMFVAAGDEGPEIADPDSFVQFDWQKLAADHGEPDWEPPRWGPGFGRLLLDNEDVDEAEGEQADA